MTLRFSLWRGSFAFSRPFSRRLSRRSTGSVDVEDLDRVSRHPHFFVNVSRAVMKVYCAMPTQLALGIGSHGRRTDQSAEQPLLICERPTAEVPPQIDSTEVFSTLINQM
jgi:hypothetical protein